MLRFLPPLPDAALELVEASASRPGERELRMVAVPWLGERFFWVTGDDPQFVDRSRPRALCEAEFVEEMRARLAERRPKPQGG